MDKVIAVFNNRNQCMQLASYLKRMNIPCKTVSTPRELSVSCGLSVIFDISVIKQVDYALQKINYSGFINMFLIKNNSNFKKYQLIRL